MYIFCIWSLTTSLHCTPFHNVGGGGQDTHTDPQTSQLIDSTGLLSEQKEEQI